MCSIKVGISLDSGALIPIEVPLKNHTHWLICGSSGSGKSILTLFLLNQLQDFATDDIFIADFKNTGDYKGITSNYAVGIDCVPLFQQYYARYCAIKSGTEKGHLWFVWEEMSGNLIWLENQNKKSAQDIKSKLAEILMMGRELAGGSVGIISVLQRPDASNFSTGSRENYHIRILLGASSVESRRMMGFLSDEIPKDFHAGIGKGLLLTDENPLPISFTVPQINKHRLSSLLQKKASV